MRSREEGGASRNDNSRCYISSYRAYVHIFPRTQIAHERRINFFFELYRGRGCYDSLRRERSPKAR